VFFFHYLALIIITTHDGDEVCQKNMGVTCFAAEQEVVERTARGKMDGMKNFRAAHSLQTKNEDDAVLTWEAMTCLSGRQ